MAVQIKEATREQLLGRFALIAVSGAGKTFTGIEIGMILAALSGKRLGVIDTENRSASKYVGEPCAAVPGGAFRFKVIELDSFHPDRYIEAIEAFEADPEVGAILVDSLSHAWIGKDGILEIKDNAAKKRGNNDYTAWREASPVHSRLVEKLVRCTKHLGVCMRAKAEYAIQTNDVTKRTEVVKLGMAAEQRGGLEYEFDLVLDVDLKHIATASKTRCRALDGRAFDVVRDTKAIAECFAGWLSAGEARREPPAFDAEGWAAKLEAAKTIEALQEVARGLGEALTVAHADDTTKARMRAKFDDLAAKLAAHGAPVQQETAPAPAPVAAEAPKGEPLTPGVDVPAMDTKKLDPAPAPGPSPRDVALAEIIDAFGKAKTVADLNRFVAPLITKYRPRLADADVNEARKTWNAMEAAIAKAGGKLP